MDMNDLMKLVNAGFTKEEIITMSGGGLETPTRTNEEKVESENVDTITTDNRATDTEKAKEPMSPPQANVNFAPMMTDAQIEKLAQLINRGSASIDMPTPRNSEDVLGEHFINLMLGKE